MGQEDFVHPLKHVTSRVLQDWAMMLVDEAESDLGLFSNDKPLYMSLVNVHGCVNGELRVVAHKDFISLLAQNLLGNSEEDGLGTEDYEDAFREMGNVLAGNFFTEAFGDDVVFALVRPVVSQISFEELKAVQESKVHFMFLADDLPLAVTFNISK